jgi:hypothetical protein
MMPSRPLSQWGRGSIWVVLVYVQFAIGLGILTPLVVVIVQGLIVAGAELNAAAIICLSLMLLLFSGFNLLTMRELRKRGIAWPWLSLAGHGRWSATSGASPPSSTSAASGFSSTQTEKRLPGAIPVTGAFGHSDG